MLKKTLLFLLTGAFLSFIPKTVNEQPKENTFTLTEGQGSMAYNSMAQARQALLNSDVPSKQVTQIILAFDSIQAVLVDQFQKFPKTK